MLKPAGKTWLEAWVKRGEDVVSECAQELLRWTPELRAGGVFASEQPVARTCRNVTYRNYGILPVCPSFDRTRELGVFSRGLQ